jgi:hypothetical protein
MLSAFQGDPVQLKSFGPGGRASLMSLAQHEQWLSNAGYKHLCFVSYPRIRNPFMRDCAIQVSQAIQGELDMRTGNPSVYLDTSIEVGTDWAASLKRELCHSLTMVALCAPIYFHPAHKWCGLEWAAMDSLCDQRLSAEGVRTIIPLIIRVSEPLPPAVSKVQYIDISQLTLTSTYHKNRKFRLHIEQVVNKIEKVASATVEHNAVVDCANFEVPAAPAFANWLPPVQPPPFRSAGQ